MLFIVEKRLFLCLKCILCPFKSNWLLTIKKQSIWTHSRITIFTALLLGGDWFRCPKFSLLHNFHTKFFIHVYPSKLIKFFGIWLDDEIFKVKLWNVLESDFLILFLINFSFSNSSPKYHIFGEILKYVFLIE